MRSASGWSQSRPAVRPTAAKRAPQGGAAAGNVLRRVLCGGAPARHRHVAWPMVISELALGLGGEVAAGRGSPKWTADLLRRVPSW